MAKTATALTDLDAMTTQLLAYKDNICKRMEVLAAPAPEPEPPSPQRQGQSSPAPPQPAPKPKKIATVRRYELCAAKRLQTKADIDKYVESIRDKLYQTLEACDGVQIS